MLRVGRAPREETDVAKLKKFEDLQDLKLYRKFLRANFKALETAPEPVPCYVSRDPIDFSDDGKAWNGHIVLFGEGTSALLKIVKKEKVRFFEDVCRKQGKNVGVRELGGPARKNATETLKQIGIKTKFVPFVDGDGVAADPEDPVDVGEGKEEEEDEEDADEEEDPDGAAPRRSTRPSRPPLRFSP